tara:strand:+ start:2615 stop:5434 length:2820 start_codon:yes stop_codon:yes gene_type:complete
MALAIIPSTQYIKYEGDADYWTNVAGLTIGDSINVSGSHFNDGVYTVIGFTQKDSDHYMMVAGRTITDEVSFVVATSASFSNGDNHIDINSSADVRVGQTIASSAGGLAAGTTITSANSSGTFGIDVTIVGLSANVTGIGGGGTNPSANLTFTSSSAGAASNIIIKGRKSTGDRLCALGDSENNVVDIWSFNSVSDPTSTDDGWIASEINPVLVNPASEHVETSEFVFNFSDEVLRVTDSNIENNSITKWYGYIQRSQFNNTKGLAFNGWHEHPVSLIPPTQSIANITSGGTEHTVATDTHYSVLNDIVEDGNGNDAQTAEALTATEDFISFEYASTELPAANSAFEVGQVYSILSTSNEQPECFMIRRPSEGSSGTVQEVRVYRQYGGAKVGDNTVADNSGAIYKRGLGWNIGVSSHADEGQWDTKEYEFYQTFIYDNLQESLPSKFNNTINVTTDLKSLECTIYSDRFYTGRISGGRIYIREKDSEDELTLFADIDINRGARMSLEDEYTAWVYRASSTAANTQNGGYYSAASSSVGLKAVRPNLDTFRTLNGYSHEYKFNSLGKVKETYQASAIVGRRNFIANVILKELDGSKRKYGDRIMYSEINKFDTILPFNFIDVSKGDFGEYTALESFADRLLAYKHNLVHIINISNPSPSGWFLEDTVQKVGVSFQHSVARTEFGVAWANEAGCFLYDGNSVKNLITNKISVNDSTNANVLNWQSFSSGTAHVKDSMVGYDAISNQLVIMRSPKDTTNNSNYCFIYDFDSNGWVFNTNMFSDHNYYTNFVTDWNNNLIVGRELSATTTEIVKYLAYQIAQSNQVLVTRDIDFGQVGLRKKIYKIILTYKSSATQANPLEYAINGTQSFTDVTTGDGTITTGAGDNDTLPTASDWDVAVFKPASPIECQSLQLRLNLPSSGTFEINDITIDYRTIRQGSVS